jgi:hypothetical protein
MEDPVMACPGVVECSGHGVCAGFPTYKCTCHAGYTGGDCSERTCKEGLVWFDLPSTSDTAHTEYAECSNKGTCNRETGQCECQIMFEGQACERST